MTPAQKKTITSVGYSLIRYCHLAAMKAGWHNDLDTGRSLTFAQQLERTPLRLCLIHSEISEALEGYRKDKRDEHLPDRPNLEVELADAVIRIADLCGALGLDLGGAIAAKMEYNETRADHTPAHRQGAGGKKF